MVAEIRVVAWVTEAEAWREIARRIAEGEWSRLGLCYEVRALYRDGFVGSVTRQRMQQRIDAHSFEVRRLGFWVRRPDRSGQFQWPDGQPGPRVLAALFLALEAEEWLAP